MKRLLSFCNVVIKGAGALTALASTPLMGMLPEKWAVYGLLAVGLSSWLKDGAMFVGDFLDNGKFDKSYKGPLPLLLLAGLLLCGGLVGCSTVNGEKAFAGLTGSDWRGLGGMVAKAAAPVAFEQFLERRQKPAPPLAAAMTSPKVVVNVLPAPVAAPPLAEAKVKRPYLDY